MGSDKVFLCADSFLVLLWVGVLCVRVGPGVSRATFAVCWLDTGFGWLCGKESLVGVLEGDEEGGVGTDWVFLGQ